MTFVRFGDRPARRAGAMLLIEGALDPLQFEDQRRTLRPDRIVVDGRRGLVEIVRSLRRFAPGLPLMSLLAGRHDWTLPALGARLPLIGVGVTGAWPPAERATRAKISSRGPNAIILPSYITIATLRADSELGR